jgi:hypothetical protein
MAEINNRSSQGDSQLQAVLDSLLADITAIRTVLGSVLSGSATWDAAAILDGDMESKDITVTGAAIGDFVMASMGVDVVDLGVSAQVTATDTVTVTLLNNTGGTVNLASTTARVRVVPQASFAAPAALTTTT